MSLSLNVPGFPKSNPISKRFFKYCLRELNITLKAHQVVIADEDSCAMCDAAGDFYLAACLPGVLTLKEVKQVCEDFEQNHALGRFIDADLNDEQGNSISSGKLKLCFFCLERPAIECRRANAHEPEELRAFMFPKMEGYCNQQREAELVRNLTSLAVRAILSEISLTPKPGLVDKFNNGSHADMNYQTFINSTAAISPWFGELVREGFSFRDSDLTKALPLIRKIGLRMESVMYDASNHVNTQKGIIFLMGLSLFACGKLQSQSDRFNLQEFQEIIRGVCKDLVHRELSASQVTAQSHGENIFRKYGFSGARGEAESGFATVFKFGLPQLAGFAELSDAMMIRCFLAIAANNDDTNILYRSNPQILNDFKSLCKNALDNFNDSNYTAVIDFCRQKNISPGGSADLLAVTIFVWLVIKAEVR